MFCCGAEIVPKRSQCEQKPHPLCNLRRPLLIWKDILPKGGSVAISASTKVFRLDSDRFKNLSDTECSTFNSGAKQYCSGAETASKAAFLVWTEALSGTLSATLRFTIRYSVNIALKFKGGTLSFHVYDCVKTDNIFFPRYFQYFFVSRMFSCFFLSQADMADFEIITFNVKGLGSFEKRRKVFNYLEKHTTANAIAFLQETHSTETSEAIWKAQWGGEVRYHPGYSHGESDSRSVLIAFREGLSFQIENEIKDKNGRILQVTIQGSNYILINIYNANTEQQQSTVLNQLDEYLDRVEINRDTQILLGGDFNFIHDLLLDADGGKPSLKLMSIATMQDLTERHNLCDVWRVRNPTNRRFTFRQKNPFLQRRLDYIFISNELQESIVNVEVLPLVNSDHSPIYLKLAEKSFTE